jgi:hypothetical protein
VTAGVLPPKLGVMVARRVVTGGGVGVLVAVVVAVAIVVVVVVVGLGGGSCGGAPFSREESSGSVAVTADPDEDPAYWTEERMASAQAAPMPTC